jgi:hypothetical protein
MPHVCAGEDACLIPFFADPVEVAFFACPLYVFLDRLALGGGRDLGNQRMLRRDEIGRASCRERVYRLV